MKNERKQIDTEHALRAISAQIQVKGSQKLHNCNCVTVHHCGRRDVARAMHLAIDYTKP